MPASKKISNSRVEGSSFGLKPDTPVKLFLNASRASHGSLGVSLRTYVVLFAAKFSRAFRQPFKVVFVLREGEGAGGVTVDLSSESELDWEVGSEADDSDVGDCLFPAVLVSELGLCVTGLCSVLRFLVKNAADQTGDGTCRGLLGYLGGCLNAPAEVSVWTHFCEVDLPKAVADVANKAREIQKSNSFVLPEAFSKFEAHLGQPIRIFNIRKRMQEEEAKGDKGAGKRKKKGSEVAESIAEGGGGGDNKERSVLERFAQQQHIFAEGPDLYLSDVILLAQYAAAERALEPGTLRALLPRTAAWLARVEAEAARADRADLLSFELAGQPPRLKQEGVSAAGGVPETSLYKTDPNRQNPTARAFTRQHDVQRVTDWFFSGGGDAVLPNEGDDSHASESAPMLDWASLPELVHPLGGHLPEKRLLKKCQQLEGLAKEVVDMVKGHPRYPDWHPTIVDFCSGGGHLAILLAFLLPGAKIVLVENKAESLRRAMDRIQLLGLTNCRFYQCNLDYFVGPFDIGVSLHACGVATDLVLAACRARGASFVCCPCCYGSLQEHHTIRYPKSGRFQDMGWEFRDYLIFGHTADQTHVDNAKTAQGRRAMDVIDSDRARHMEESGRFGRVRLARLRPPTCTPKNNVIVGVSKTQMK